MKKYTSSENTKAAIIDAAGLLAAEMGFSNVSTRAVAKKSGENIGSIHYHFGSKDGLFEAVVRTAITDFATTPHWELTKELSADNTPQELSNALRLLVQQYVAKLFNSDKPQWHSHIVYQVLQRDDALYAIVEKEILRPDLEGMQRFFKSVDPDMNDAETFLRTAILQLPIFGHCNYRVLFQRKLNVEQYPEEYLKKMEELIFEQTRISLNLPKDEQA